VFYIDLFRTLQEHEVRYLVVGGLAVNLYGVERATMDVDLMVAMDGENVGRFIQAARILRLKPVPPVPLEALADETTRTAWFEQKGMIVFALQGSDPGAPTVDVLIRPQIGFEEAWLRRVEKSIGNLTVRLASIDDLIRMKVATGRQRDRSDIEALEKARRLTHDRED
jgi:hypothetical protein